MVAGGPGTGKTTTVARILALLDEQAAAAGRPPPRVALAAPTGKAAARLEEAVHAEAAKMPLGDDERARLLALSGSTLHRLLGWRPDSRSRFRHHRDNRLPHDVVVVDEASMVSLSLMAKLIDAVRTDARLILVGDPDQLASVEAGAVLGDIVGAGTYEGIVVLRRVHRFGGAIAELATAIQRGDEDAAVAVLRAGHDDVRWIDLDVAAGDVVAALQPVRDAVVDAGRRITDAARAGDARGALDALRAMRVLCAHRRGPYGVAEWTAQIESWLAAAIPGYGDGGPWYVGRPLLVTENDYGLRLFNGDTGVVVDAGEGRTVAAFDRTGGLFEVSPRRLGSVDTVHAMTVHKSQGSQFDAVAVILPDAESPILTRELLYTAVTRAQRQLTVVGTEDSIRAAVGTPDRPGERPPRAPVGSAVASDARIEARCSTRIICQRACAPADRHPADIRATKPISCTPPTGHTPLWRTDRLLARASPIELQSGGLRSVSHTAIPALHRRATRVRQPPEKLPSPHRTADDGYASMAASSGAGSGRSPAARSACSVRSS